MSLEQRSPEEQEYWDEHFRIFGHHPIPDLTGKHKCAHPIHEEFTRVMKSPGLELEFPFDVRSVYSTEDPAVKQHNADYDRTVADLRSKIREIEERAKREDSGKKEIF